MKANRKRKNLAIFCDSIDIAVGRCYLRRMRKKSIKKIANQIPIQTPHQKSKQSLNKIIKQNLGQSLGQKLGQKLGKNLGQKLKQDSSVFGGSLLKGNARIARPISTQKPVHVVMKSRLAKGEKSFSRMKRAKQIEQVVKKIAYENDIKMQRFANGGDHLHFVLKTPSRKSFNSFLRAISGLIARISLGAERGKPVDKQFWESKPYSKILDTEDELKRVYSQVMQKKPEATGFAIH